MCGICGSWGGGSEAEVRSMMAAMRHRGPNDEGAYADEKTALGMTRLAILDVSAAGHQPMANGERSVWIVYNGETYNFGEERARLQAQGHVFASNSDTEVVLKLYEQHGDDFLLKLRGMFALALYDRRGGPGRERLVLARDPLGIKPLLYATHAGGLVFASELKALLAGGRIGREVSAAALHGLLAQGSVAQPGSILEGVRMLPPGHRLIAAAGRVTVERYWKLDTGRAAGVDGLPYPEQVRRLRLLLEDSVRAHMVSDVPVGAFLSGGIDSTVLVALMARMTGRKVRTFSVGFQDEGAAIDESDDAARAAAAIGTDHTRVLVTGREVGDRLAAIAAALDQPSVDGVNSYFVSRAAAGGVRVAISGTGGDELFAGYPWFAAMAAAAPTFTAPRRFAARLLSGDTLERAAGPYGARVLGRLRARGDFLESYSRQYRIFGDRGAREVLDVPPSRLAHALRDRDRAAAADELPGASVVARVSALTLRGYTQNQLLRDIDAVSMAHSLEVRVPFLDPLLADFALALPDGAKLAARGGGDTYRASGAKRILIDAARDLLPPDIDLQPKRGFGMPFDAWLRGPLREALEDTLSARAVEARGYFDAAAVRSVHRDFVAKRASWALPWVLMMFELWCRAVLDAPASRSAA
jgi:asparagine synthase (glutamine-hydrolysing)